MTNPQEILNGPYAKFYRKFGDPTEELHAAYDSWLADMAARPDNRLEPFEFDLAKYPEQSIYVPKVQAQEAYPNLPDSIYYNFFKVKMARSLGGLAALRLLNQFQQHPVSAENPSSLPARLRANQAIGKNTMIITSHAKFQEFGYVMGLKHMAKRNRDNIDQNGALISNLMTRQRYKREGQRRQGKTLVEHFRQGGHVYFSNPKSLSATEHGVPETASNLTNALFRKVLKSDLKIGGLELDIALTGSEVKRVKNERGELTHYAIPQVDPGSAELLGDFDDAVAITMVGPPMAESWQMAISDMYDLTELLKTNTPGEVTDIIYGGIRQDLELFTQKEVVYNKLGHTAISS